MKRNEFMEELGKYLSRAGEEEAADILADYGAHFDAAEEAGFTDEEIINDLGNPAEIYESYKREGLISEKNRLAAFSSRVLEKTGHMVSRAEVKSKPYALHLASRVPQLAEEFLGWIGKAAEIGCGMAALIVAVFTVLAVGVLASSIQIVPWLAPFPVLHPLTLLGAGVCGLSVAGMLYYAGQTVKNASVHTNEAVLEEGGTYHE